MFFLLLVCCSFTSCAGAEGLLEVPHNASYSADKQINTVRTLHNKNSVEFGVSPFLTLSQNRAGPEVIKNFMPNPAQ